MAVSMNKWIEINYVKNEATELDSKNDEYYQTELDKRLESSSFMKRILIRHYVQKYNTILFHFSNKLDLARRVMKDIPEECRKYVSLVDIMEELTLIGPLESSGRSLLDITPTSLHW